jgi:hypothetical protein
MTFFDDSSSSSSESDESYESDDEYALTKTAALHCNMWSIVRAYLCRGILIMCGWREWTTSALQSIVHATSTVMYVTSSANDKWLLWLYFLSIGEVHRVRFLCMVDSHTTWTMRVLYWIGKWLQLVVFYHESQHSSFVVAKQIVQSTQGPLILISTPATQGQPEWNKSWYYIALALKAPIRAIGLNYHPLIRTVHIPTGANRSIIMSKDIRYDQALKNIKSSLSLIYPASTAHVTLRTPRKTSLLRLLPNSIPTSVCSNFQYVPHACTSVVDVVVLTVCMMTIPLFISAMEGMKIHFILILCSMIAGVKYHLSYEQNTRWKHMHQLFVCLHIGYEWVKMWQQMGLHTGFWILGLTLGWLVLPSRQDILRSSQYTYYQALCYTWINVQSIYYCYYVNYVFQGY